MELRDETMGLFATDRLKNRFFYDSLQIVELIEYHRRQGQPMKIYT